MTQSTVKEIILKEKHRVTVALDKYIFEQKSLELEYDKYFEGIKKYSNDFVLEKTERTYTKNITYRHENGVLITVGKISKNYNECKIKYVGSVPPGRTINSFTMDVREHVTYGRGYWHSNSKGFKLYVEIHYDEKFYYKSPGHFVRKITSTIDSWWNSYNHEQKRKNDQKIALAEAKKRFKTKNVILLGGNNIAIKTNCGEIRFYYKVDNETNKVDFTFNNFNAINVKNEKVDEFVSFICEM